MLSLISMLGFVVAGTAVWRRVRRRRRGAAHRARSPWHRRASLLIVIAIVAVTGAVGSPAFADPLSDLCNSKAAPDPEWPGSGLVGTIDRPTLGSGESNSVYGDYSYAGLVWNNYDLGCTNIANPGAQLDTWLGNQIFNGAKLLIGTTNWAHYAILDGHSGGLMSPLDGLIRTGVNAMWDSIFVRWISIALVVLAVMLLVWSGRGDLPKQTQRLALAFVALAAAGASYLAPATWSSNIDTILFDSTADLHDGFLPGSDRDTLPTLLVDRVVYQNWLRGEFGSADGRAATTYGRQLLSAQAYSKDDVLCPTSRVANPTGPCADGREDGSADLGKSTTELHDKKKELFKQIGEELEKGDSAYAYFQGRKGSRVGPAVLAVIQAGCLAFFQLFANVVLLLALVIIRLVIIALPAIAVIAVVRPGILSNLLRLVGAALTNALIMAGLAGLHAMVVTSIFDPNNGVETMFALMLSMIISLLMWAIARPVKRMIAMTRMAGEQIGLGQYDPSTRMRRQLRRHYRRLSRRNHGDGDEDERWWDLNAHRSGADERPEQGAGNPRLRASIVTEGSRRARPHGAGDPSHVGRGVAAIAAGPAGREVPGSGKVWAQGSPDPKQLGGPPTRRALPAGTGDSTVGSRSENGGGSPPAAPGRRALPAANAAQPPGATDSTPAGNPGTAPKTASAQALEQAHERHRDDRGAPARGGYIYDTDQQEVIADWRGGEPRHADMQTDADGNPVYVVVWDSRAQSFLHDQLPPSNGTTDEESQ